jgi:hypothetical protein
LLPPVQVKERRELTSHPVDQCSEIIIFEPIFATFEVSSFFEAAGATAKIGSSFKSK